MMLRSETYFHYWVGLLLMWQCLVVSNTCPTNCSCFTSFSYVACTGQTFSTIPDDIPNDTETLKLVHNELVELDLPALYPLTELKVLDVRENDILAIHGSFKNFPLLREVYLGQNNLSAISPETFGNTFRKLRYIDLTGNPFNCQCMSAHKCSKDDPTPECNILWLQRQVHQNPDRFGRKVLCHNPDEVRGQFLDYVNISEPKCHAGNTGNLHSITLALDVLSKIVSVATALIVVLALVMIVHKTRNWAVKSRRECSSPLDDLSGQINDAYIPDDASEERPQYNSRPANDRNEDPAEQHTDDDNETETHRVAEHTPSSSSSSNHNKSLPPDGVPTGEQQDHDATTGPENTVIIEPGTNLPSLCGREEVENHKRQSHRYRSVSLSIDEDDDDLN